MTLPTFTYSFTVERDPPSDVHWTMRPPFDTFEHFCESRRNDPYQYSVRRAILDALSGIHVDRDRGTPPHFQWRFDVYRLGFALRMRVPDAEGYFGTTKSDGTPITGAAWCLPWNWERRYYEHRVLARCPK